MYRVYLTGQFVSWNFGNLWKQSLGFGVMRIELYVSDTKRNNLFKFMKTLTESQRVSDLFENILIKIRFINWKHMKNRADILLSTQWLK